MPGGERAGEDSDQGARSRAREAACHDREETMRTLGALVVTASTLAAVGTLAQTTAKISDDVVKIGLILDMSSLYADITGTGSVAAAQLAIDDFGGNIAGKPIQLVHADHQNKARRPGR
jgi:branched-chain amino acid transport system substrate-binding protein